MSGRTPPSKAATILPQEGKRNTLVTSALPYVNNVPHLGNIIGSVLSADAYSRYCKARGWPTLYICGTDEYGTATETKAIEEKTTPYELCTKYYHIHKEVYDWFGIAFDYFGRTTTQAQTDIAQDIFLKLYHNGYMEEKETTQPYCEHPDHQSFLADRFVEGECPICHYPDARGDQCDSCGELLDPMNLINPHCKLDKTTPVVRDARHVFLCLDKLQPKIAEWFKVASKEGAWSANGISITDSWLTKGLKPHGITRDLKWGTPVPLKGYEKKVLYVWFDACIGYPSITANYTDQWEKWWRNPEQVKLYQFLGKDNVRFHTAVFPGSQIGTGDRWTMLHHLSTTEYLNYEHTKFSKSRGVGVFGNSAKDTGVPADVWRFYLLHQRPETGDSEFEWVGFIDSNNNELVKNVGNFVNRVIKFLNSPNYNSVVPQYTDYNDALLHNHQKETNEKLKSYIENMDAVKLRAGLVNALDISSLGNKLLQDNKVDNKLAQEEPNKCAAVIGLAVNHVHLLATLIAPYMPATTESVLKQLNTSPLTFPEDWDKDNVDWTADSIKPGHKIGKAFHLFSTIKPEKEQEWKDQFGGREAEKAREEAAAKAAEKKAARDKAKNKEKKEPAPAESEETIAAKKAAKKAEKAAKLAKSKEYLAAKAKEDGKVEASVETIEKGERHEGEKTGIDEVTAGVEQTNLQTS